MLKTLSAMLFFMLFVLGGQAAWAQNTSTTQEETTEETNDDWGDDTGDDWGDDSGDWGDEELLEDQNQQTVTLEGDEDGDYGSMDEGDDSYTESKPATKIHIYSGKHDGDNVINYEPRRQ